MRPFSRCTSVPKVVAAWKLVFDFEVGKAARSREEMVPCRIESVKRVQSTFVGFRADELTPERVKVLGDGRLGRVRFHQTCFSRELDEC